MPANPIVAATDGSAESLRAVDWAVREAALRGAPLRIVSAAALMPGRIGSHAMSGFDAIAEALRAERERALEVAAQRAAGSAPGLLIDADALDGPPAEAVTHSGHGAQLLVVGSRGRGEFAAMVLGSVSRHVATHASCPVVVVGQDISPASRQIGIGIGDTEDAASLTFAFEEAALRQAGLIALHSWHMPDADFSRAGPILSDQPIQRAEQSEVASRLAELLDRWRAKYPGVPVSQEVVHSHPGRALVGLSARADLVVLGRRPAHYGPAAVTHAVLGHAHSPIVTVPAAS